MQILQLTPMQIFEKQWQAYQKVLVANFARYHSILSRR